MTTQHSPQAQCGIILNHLKQHKRISNFQILAMGITRGAARINNLNNEGHQIRGERDPEVKALYWYVYEGLKKDFYTTHAPAVPATVTSSESYEAVSWLDDDEEPKR